MRCAREDDIPEIRATAPPGSAAVTRFYRSGFFMGSLRPSKRPTPGEFAVLVVSTSLFLIAAGIIALVIAVRAPDSKRDLAAALAYRGFGCLGLGLVIAFGYWVLRRLRDYE